MLRIVDDSDALSPGITVAGKYTLERVVGEGGMGVVWAARHVLTHKVCALKFLKERRAKDPKSYERLLREARAACAVRHPNVAQVHDLLELPSGAPFIVMDLLEGEPLSKRLEREHSLSANDTLVLLADTMDAVLAAHAHGIVHRDLKPDNVFLERNGVAAKVLDFGIAKHAEVVDDALPENVSADLSRSVTSTYSVLGTPKYMAPEQAKPPGKVSFASDVWALGMIAFECATGELPPPVGEDGRATTIRQKLAGFPSDVAVLVAEMLSEDPADRPALDEARGRVGRALQKSAPRGARAELVALGAVVVAVLAIGAWVWTSKRAAANAEPAPVSASIAERSIVEPPPTTPAATSASPLSTASAPHPIATTAVRPPTPTSSTHPLPRASAPPAASASAPVATGNGIPTHVRD